MGLSRRLLNCRGSIAGPNTLDPRYHFGRAARVVDDQAGVLSLGAGALHQQCGALSRGAGEWSRVLEGGGPTSEPCARVLQGYFGAAGGNAAQRAASLPESAARNAACSV